MNTLTNTNGVGNIDPKDTINVPGNEPFPTKSSSGLPEREGETAIVHGGDGIVQQQRLAHDVPYGSTVPVALDDGTDRANQIQRTQAGGVSGEFVDGGVASSNVPPVGGNETAFDGSGKVAVTAPEGKPFGVENRAGGIDWFATEEQAQQYADSNPGFFRIREEAIAERDRDLTDEERRDVDEHMVWSKDDNGQLHQFANEKARTVMLESEPLLGHAYVPTVAEIDAYDGVMVTEGEASERLDAPRDTARVLGPVSADGKWYARSNDGETRAFDSEADRDAYVGSTPGTVPYRLPAE